jgi:hypothetical protein
MKYGAVFAIGSGHHINGNTFTRLNTAHCPEGPACNWGPEMLGTGIYLADRAERADPAVGIVIENNTISGWGMAKHCIGAAPGVKLGANTVRKNGCTN